MEDMAQEFGDMLKETLDRMRERIEVQDIKKRGIDHGILSERVKDIYCNLRAVLDHNSRDIFPYFSGCRCRSGRD